MSYHRYTSARKTTKIQVMQFVMMWRLVLLLTMRHRVIRR